ncbi:MAG: hypothetical protein WBK65_07345, partial [Thermotogota bacterium]
VFPERQADWKSAPRVIFTLFSVFSVPSVRTLFFKTGTKAYRAVAKRRSAYAAMTTRTKNRTNDSDIAS